MCQGVDLVEAELLVGIGGMAWAFSIGKKRDAATGRAVDVPDHDYTSLLISRPRPFDFDLRARSEERGGAVRDNWAKVRTMQMAGPKDDRGKEKTALPLI